MLSQGNASPDSQAAALAVLGSMNAKRKIAVIGDMLELGDDSQAEHEAVIRAAMDRGFSKVYFVGGEFAKAASNMDTDPTKAMFFDTSDLLKSHIQEMPVEGAVVLIKGSRGTRMEKVIDSL